MEAALLHAEDKVQGSPVTAPVDKVRVRLISYNVFLRPPPVGSCTDHKDARCKELVETVFGGFDVVCLQEMFGSFSRRRTNVIRDVQKHGLLYSAACPVPWPLCSGKLIDGGLLTLSKYKIVEHEFTPFQRGMDSDALAKKGVLYTKINLPNNKHMHIFSTHVQASYVYTADPGSVRIKQEQIGVLVALVKSKLATSSAVGPVVVTGDFNINSLMNEKFAEGSPRFGGSGIAPEEYSYLTESLEQAVHELDNYENDVLDIFLEHNANQPIATTCPFEWKLNDETELRCSLFVDPQEDLAGTDTSFWAPQRLDYCFLVNPKSQGGGKDTPVAVVKSCKVEPFSTSERPYRQLSDHHALLVEFEV
jgi:endonuclease/exonuclease/phosphatase family metal-dependent hydrolase